MWRTRNIFGDVKETLISTFTTFQYLEKKIVIIHKNEDYLDFDHEFPVMQDFDDDIIIGLDYLTFAPRMR